MKVGEQIKLTKIDPKKFEKFVNKCNKKLLEKEREKNEKL